MTDQAQMPATEASSSTTAATTTDQQPLQSTTSTTSNKDKRRSMLDYFKSKRQPKEKEAVSSSKGKEKAPTTQPDEPVLNEEDEAFLTHIISRPETEDDVPPPLPERPALEPRSTDAQVILMQGADKVPLPDAPETPEGEVARAIEGEPASTTMVTTNDSKQADDKAKAKSNRWSFLNLRRSSSRAVARRDKEETAISLAAAADALKSPPKPADAKPNEEGQVSPAEAKEEEDEMAAVLEQLNLTATNNRVFSISNESKELMKNFTLVLKDLVNGVPTAYHDLESLLTNSDQQLQKAYKSLPPFLQDLIEKLPERFGKSLGPEFLAAAAAEKQGVNSGYLGKGASAAEKLGLKLKVPSLKDLVTKQGTLVALLRSVMQALRTRFPAFLGMNVLWSLALFVLLFVFWYCHKRGREVRLEKERAVTETEMAAIADLVRADPAWSPPEGWREGTTRTRAPEGASIEEVQAGMLPAPEVGDGSTAGAPAAATYAPEGSLGRAMREKEEAEKKKRAAAVEEEQKVAKVKQARKEQLARVSD